jgi:hypothetical protein
LLDTGEILQERYQLQRRLGRTAVGHQTWLAVDLQSQEEVTVKMLAFSPEMHWEELKGLQMLGKFRNRLAVALK